VGNVVGGGAQIVGKGGRLAVGGVGAVAGGVGFVGKGVLSGVRNVVPGTSRRNTAASTMYEAQDASDQDISNGGSALNGPRITPSSDVNGRIAYAPVGGGSPDFGQLQVTVTEIQGVPQDEKVHVQLHHGVKQHEKPHIHKNAATGHNDVIFNLKTLPEAMNLTFSLVVRKAFGKDRTIGTADLDLWSLIHPGTQNSADTMLSTGAGQSLAVSLSWTANGSSAGNAGSVSPSTSRSLPPSASGGNVPDSPSSTKSKPRFSMHRNGKPLLAVEARRTV
jgi:hypothetical protein